MQHRLLVPSPSAEHSALLSISPHESGCDEYLLNQAHDDIHQNYPRMHSFLVIKGGKLTYERYYNGHTATTLNDLRSVTKSFTSILAGIAIARQELPNIDHFILDVLQHYAPYGHDMLLHRITLRHLLTMSSGFSWITGKRLGEPWINLLHRSANWSSFALSLPIQEAMMGTFQYRSTDSHLISVMLSACTGRNLSNYAQTHLFAPLGIEHTSWTSSPEGHSMGHVGLYLTSRDMGKFGMCCLNKGVWEGKQVIPENWLTEALSPQVKGYPAFGDYGFQWWYDKIDGEFYSCALGFGGQQIYLFPKLDAVIIFTANSKVSRYKNPRSLLQRFILPSMK